MLLFFEIMEKKLVLSFSESRNTHGYPDTFYNTFEIKHGDQVILEKAVTFRNIVSPGNVEYKTDLKFINMAKESLEFDSFEDAINAV